MKLSLGLCAVLAVAAGCTPADREGIASGGRQAFDKAYEASAGAVNSAIASVAKVDLSSSTAQLEAAREQASNALQKLRGIEIGPVQEQVERLRLEIERIDKAIAEQNLKEKWDAALVKANQGKRLAESQIAGARDSLLKTSEEFRALDAQLEAAKQAYQQASDRVRELAGAR